MKYFVLMCVCFLFVATGCKKKEGCTNSLACNYDATAHVDNGTCQLIYGCMDFSADNYNFAACQPGGLCTYSGTHTYYTSSGAYGDISIWIDGMYIGKLTSFWISGGPVCSAGSNSDHIRNTVTLPSSTGVSYHITASGSVSGVWDFWRTYNANACNLEELI